MGDDKIEVTVTFPTLRQFAGLGVGLPVLMNGKQVGKTTGINGDGTVSMEIDAETYHQLVADDYPFSSAEEMEVKAVVLDDYVVDTAFDADLKESYNWRHPIAWAKFQFYYRRAKWLNR